MKQITLLLLALLSVTVTVWGQKTTLIGAVKDTSGAAIAGASAILLEEKDSVLVLFTSSNADGQFTLKRIEKGNYLLQISAIGMETHYQTMLANPERAQIDLGIITLSPANVLLNGVDITTDRTPLRISNDTITYNANAFQVQPGSVVEDLLRNMPGLEVQSDGTVKAQGEVVRNIMVDGKEFFGQDPKIATKNLPADAVDKVQVFNKKSERAEFTGIEDGKKEKTINLQLKDGAKSGYFGNANGGYGTKGRFENKFNLNKFSGKTQLSAIGSSNNNNQQTFSFDDYLGFMGGLSNLMSGSGSGGRVRITLGDDNLGLPGLGTGTGFTTAIAGGLHLNHDFSKKTKLNANYFYNHIRNDLDRTATRDNLLGSEVFRANSRENQRSQNNNHRLNLTLRSQIDSSQNITLRSHWVLNDALFDSDNNNTSLRPGGFIQNESGRNYRSTGNSWRGDGALTYRRRLAKRGRFIMADASFQKNDDRRNGQLSADNQYFGFQKDSLESIRQRQKYADNATNWGGSLSFTEPLGRKQYVEVQVGHRQYANTTGKNFYDQLPTPAEVFNPLLSTQFQRGYRYERGSLNYSRNRSTLELTTGVTLQQSVLEGRQTDIEAETIRRTFTRLLPNLFLQYEPKAGSIANLDYSTSLQEPSLEQLQPIVDNSNPVEIYTGNPNLRPEYIHEIHAGGMRFDAFSNTSFFVNSSATYTLNKMTNASNIDALLRRSLQPINVKNDFLLRNYVNFSRPIRPLKCNINLTANSTYNRGILWVNGIKNNTNRWDNSFEIALDNRRKKKLDLEMGARLGQNITRYTVQNNLNQSFFKQRYFVNCTVFPNPHWAVSSGFDMTIYSNQSFGAAQQIPLWKASITRYVLRNRKGQIKLSAFDLLNRNIGITRTSQFNYLEEVRTRNLSRYFMLTFAYSISGFASPQNNGIEIKRIGGE